MAAAQVDDVQLEDEELETTEQEETTAEVEATPPVEKEVAEVQAGDDDVEAGAGPAYSADTLELAARAGLDPYDYKDEAAFYRAVARQDRQFADLQRHFGGQQRQPTPNPAEQKQPTTSQVQALKRLELEKYFKATPDGEVDPNIVQAFKDLHDGTFGHLETLQQKLASYEAMQQRLEELENRHRFEEERRFVAEWDAYFAGVGDEYRDKIGKGDRSEVSQHHLMTRDAIVSTALALRKMDEDRGLRPLSNKQYGQRALLSVLGQDTTAIARKDILTKAKARTGAALAPASIKKAPAKSAEDRAWAVFNEKAKKIGLKRDDDE